MFVISEPNFGLICSKNARGKDKKGIPRILDLKSKACKCWCYYTDNDADFNTLADVLVQKTPGCQLLKGEADPKVFWHLSTFKQGVLFKDRSLVKYKWHSLHGKFTGKLPWLLPCLWLWRGYRGELPFLKEKKSPLRVRLQYVAGVDSKLKLT